MTRRDNDAFVVIHDFMMHELGLNGITLLVYARIYGFCSNGKADFYESKQSTARFLNTSDRTVFRALKELTESGLVIEIGLYEPKKGCATKRYRINWDKLDWAREEYKSKSRLPPDNMSPPDGMSSPDKLSGGCGETSDDLSVRNMTSCQVIRKVDNKEFR